MLEDRKEMFAAIDELVEKNKESYIDFLKSAVAQDSRIFEHVTFNFCRRAFI